MLYLTKILTLSHCCQIDNKEGIDMGTHKIARSSARLKECGGHFHIVLADGRRGPALFSIGETLELLQLLKGSDLLSDDEVCGFEWKIYYSTLHDETPSDIDVVEDLLESRCCATGMFDDEDLINFDVEELFEHPEQSEGHVLH